jgi:hypothetical protein
MPGGFGGGSWGGGAFGGSSSDSELLSPETITISEALDVDVPLQLVGALSLSAVWVRVEFSHDLDPAFLTNYTPSNYDIPSLTVLSVNPGPTAKIVILNTATQGSAIYSLTVATARSAPGDLLEPPSQMVSFAGFPVVPTFMATAQSKRKVVCIFSTAMLVDAALEDPANYVITDLGGSAVSVSSVDPFLDGSRLTLNLGTDLASGGYYNITVDPSVHTSDGLSLSPPTSLFQWTAMEAALTTGPLSISFAQFSGEVTGGLLGQPAGLLFFSPALLEIAPSSVIQVEEASLCTRGYDSYEFPQPIDPPPLFTFSAKAPQAVLGPTSVLWAPAERLGLARIILTDSHEETMPTAEDGPADATLVEPIDITRAGFLNDARWHLFDGAATTFITADNLTPIGPGPTVNINLEP